MVDFGDLVKDGLVYVVLMVELCVMFDEFEVEMGCKYELMLVIGVGYDKIEDVNYG